MLDSHPREKEATGLFLEEIDITFIEPCVADPGRIRLYAEPSRDIAEVLPYLNAVMNHATYNKDGPSLTFMKEFRLITVHSRKITMSKALNTTDAWQVLDWLKDLINETYERRGSIAPAHGVRYRPTALQMYEWLPRTNCKVCGEPTCLAFAVKLLLAERKAEECKPLFLPQHVNLRRALFEIVAALGYEVPGKEQ
ncbi:MAG: (Fe-S)-binding protein [Bacillota bacterium]